MNVKLRSLFSKLSLFGATLIWGGSFFVMKDTLNSIPPYYLLSLRFLVGAITLSIIFIKKYKNFSIDYIAKGAILGIFLFIAYVFQTKGLIYTTPGKNAFLTVIYCIMVPFLYWLYSKVRPDIYNIIASIICVIGIGLVSVNEALTINIGDILTMTGGLFFALHIIAIAVFSKGKDIILLTIIQFASSGIISLIFALLFEEPPKHIESVSFISLIYLCFFATTVGLLLQNIGQKYVSPSSAAIILSLESVFGVLFSIIFYKEVLNLKTAIGFFLIFAAIIISETKLEFLRKQKENTGI